MPYDIERSCEDIEFGGVFQQVQRLLGMNIGADATDPLDHTSLLLKRTTPMTPCHAGADHAAGIWMPLRYSYVDTAETAPVLTVAVDDAEPFKVGDTVQLIDVGGPAVAVTNLGPITAINYTTDVLTVTNAAIQVLDDIVEVTENGLVLTDDYITPQTVGLLRNPNDMRVKPTDAAGTMMDSVVVVEGAIRDEDIWFNVAPSADTEPNMIYRALRVSAGGLIEVIERPHV